VWDGIRRQSELCTQLCDLVHDLSNVRGNARKVERLRALLGEGGGGCQLAALSDPMPHPLDPSVQLRGKS
jgi:hypothetical protein